MLDTDEIYKKLERHYLVNPLRSSGAMENAMMQRIGRIYNMEFPGMGKLADEMLGNVERKLAGREKHGYHQNMKSDAERMIELGEKIADGWI